MEQLMENKVTRDPIRLMRECVRGNHGMSHIRIALGIDCNSGWQMRCLEALADGIEAQYMKLPVDSDGVPIRPGDEVVYRGVEPFTCYAVSQRHAHTWDAGAHAIGHLACKCRHAKKEQAGEFEQLKLSNSRDNWKQNAVICHASLRAMENDRDFWRKETERLRVLLDSVTKQLADYQDEGMA